MLSAKSAGEEVPQGRGKTHLPEGGAETPAPSLPFSRREDSLCILEKASRKEDPQGWDQMRSAQEGEGRGERGVQE